MVLIFSVVHVLIHGFVCVWLPFVCDTAILLYSAKCVLQLTTHKSTSIASMVAIAGCTASLNALQVLVLMTGMLVVEYLYCIKHIHCLCCDASRLFPFFGRSCPPATCPCRAQQPLADSFSSARSIRCASTLLFLSSLQSSTC